ncbi:MAG TPA: DUF2520 domain-containing protein [Terriglobales bacterium]|nr:DUF2520 domain-containing protein [Terriglobales bacterium]
MLPAMAKQLRVAVVGPGRLGRALAIGLKQAGYRVEEIVSRTEAASRRRARALAREVGARAVTAKTARLDADLIWLCVPDREIAKVARRLAGSGSWKGKVAFHPSGALGSDELEALRQQGASVASVHPFMTFVRGSVPRLGGVPFGLEGDGAALRLARRVIHNVGGHSISVSKRAKAAYHAWGGFLSPLLLSLLVTAERVAATAGFSAAQARRWAMPIVQQTLTNYARLGPAGAFSGPLVRGDVTVVKKHLQALKKISSAHEVYVALGNSALENLPTKNRAQLRKVLTRGSRVNA